MNHKNLSELYESCRVQLEVVVVQVIAVVVQVIAVVVQVIAVVVQVIAVVVQVVAVIVQVVAVVRVVTVVVRVVAIVVRVVAIVVVDSTATTAINDPTNTTYPRWRRQFNHDDAGLSGGGVKTTRPAATTIATARQLDLPVDFIKDPDNMPILNDTNNNPEATDDNLDATRDTTDDDTIRGDDGGVGIIIRLQYSTLFSNYYSTSATCYESGSPAYKTGLYQSQTGLNLNRLRPVS
ncbi:hypothetical protein EDB89DRAFT_1912644 [Lactarius sanguifluus]|nr:hypothetical protein EDB89DRAFT_1912644 [Lactarius sanguifluus]